MNGVSDGGDITLVENVIYAYFELAVLKIPALRTWNFHGEVEYAIGRNRVIVGNLLSLIRREVGTSIRIAKTEHPVVQEVFGGHAVSLPEGYGIVRHGGVGLATRQIRCSGISVGNIGRPVFRYLTGKGDFHTLRLAAAIGIVVQGFRVLSWRVFLTDFEPGSGQPDGISNAEMRAQFDLVGMPVGGQLFVRTGLVTKVRGRCSCPVTEQSGAVADFLGKTGSWAES